MRQLGKVSQALKPEPQIKVSVTSFTGTPIIFCSLPRNTALSHVPDFSYSPRGERERAVGRSVYETGVRFGGLTSLMITLGGVECRRLIGQ